MERELIKVTPDTELSEVVDMLLTEKVPSLMVLDDLTEELVGIISYVDILSVFQEKENHLKLAA
jgi:CBS domain-containing protein